MATRVKRPALDNDGTPAESPPLHLSMSTPVRSKSLALLALIAFIVFLHWAQAVLIPITFAVLLSYALTPVVNWLKRKAKLHKAVGAALT